MRVIRALRGRNRFNHASRVLRRERSHPRKRYEEFEDIINEVSVQDEEAICVDKGSQVLVPETLRNAFDVVSEYLSHSSNADDPFPVTDDDNNNADCSSSHQKKVYDPLSGVENRVISTDDAPIYRCVNGREGFQRQKLFILSGRPSSRPACVSPVNPSTGGKSAAPLTEVSTNVAVSHSVEFQQTVRKPANDASENTPPSGCQSAFSSDTSAPYLKTLLTGCTDTRHSVAAFGDNSGPKITNGGDATTTANPSGIRSCKENSKGEIQVPVKEKPIVIVTITQQSEPASITTQGYSMASNLRLSTLSPQETYDESSGVLSDVHNLIRCTALAGSDLVDNNGLANSSVISHISATVAPPIGTLQPPDSRRVYSLTSLTRNRIRRSNVMRFSNDTTAASLHQRNTSGAAKTKSSIRTRHPFMHFWESEGDQVAVNRGWRSRRRAYLSLLCSHSETEQITMASNGSRQARRRSDYAGLLYPLGKGGVYSRRLLGSEDTSVAAQSQMLSQLEPVILGYRWSDSDQTPSEANREVMVMWN